MRAKARYAKMAKQVRKAAVRYYKRSLRECFDAPVIEGYMLKMFKQDLKDLRRFARFVGQGSINRAEKMIRNELDTAVYEVIPLSVYNYVVR